MGCGCKGKGAKKFDVVASSGRIIYTTDSKATAMAVAARYKEAGATVQTKDTG